MKVRSDSLHRRVHDALNGCERPPTSLCAYFWRIVLSIFTLPLSWPVNLICHYQGDMDPPHFFVRSWLGFIMQAVVLAVSFGGLAIGRFVGFSWDEPLIMIAFMIGIFPAIAVLFWVFLQGLSIWASYTDRSENKGESIIAMRVKAHKEKVCPILEWDTND
jgi:hypothetical protein